MKEKNLLQYKKEKNNDMANRVKKVQCPCCTNKRLMDMLSAEQAEFEIKCQKCGRTIHLLFEKNQIYTEAV